MHALDVRSRGEFYLVPKTEGDAVRGPQGASPLNELHAEEERARSADQRRGSLDAHRLRPGGSVTSRAVCNAWSGPNLLIMRSA